MTAPSNPICMACGEAVEADWTFCPACEAPLGQPTCSACRRAVKPHWKRCPTCGQRLSAGRAEVEPAFHLPPVVEPRTGIELIFVSAGCFEMGDTGGDGSENERPVHTVSLSGFYLGRVPVTQGQWMRLMPENPSRFQKGDTYPVEQVRWEDVGAFLDALNRVGDGHFRLPSEAEWEYAARSGGKPERYSGGDRVEDVAWFEANSGGTTHPVGQKKPNALGLCDMSGNVWEWCLDRFDPAAYPLHPPRDPVWEQGGLDRVIRGGSWNLDAWSARCTRRFGYPPGFAGPALGFRVLMALPAG